LSVRCFVFRPLGLLDLPFFMKKSLSQKRPKRPKVSIWDIFDTLKPL